MSDEKASIDLSLESDDEPEHGNNLVLHLKAVRSLMFMETRTEIPAAFGEVTLTGYKLLEVNQSAASNEILVHVETPNGDEIQCLCSRFTVAR